MFNNRQVQQLSIKCYFQTHKFQYYMCLNFSNNCQSIVNLVFTPITISNNIFNLTNFSINYQTIVCRNNDINPIKNNIFYCTHYSSIINQIGISNYTIKPISINNFCFIFFPINYQSIIFYTFCYQTNIKQFLNRLKVFNTFQ